MLYIIYNNLFISVLFLYIFRSLSSQCKPPLSSLTSSIKPEENKSNKMEIQGKQKILNSLIFVAKLNANCFSVYS